MLEGQHKAFAQNEHPSAKVNSVDFHAQHVLQP
jgi:hypothetical protein